MGCTVSQIYLIKYSTCYGQDHCPSSRVSQNCIHTTGICHANSVGFYYKNDCLFLKEELHPVILELFP